MIIEIAAWDKNSKILVLILFNFELCEFNQEY